MVLQRVHELECGDSNSYCSWSLVRGHKAKDGTFTYDEDEGKTYFCVQPNTGGVRYDWVPDRDRGARKRLALIMERYPDLIPYIQGDPRGAPLYIANKSDGDINNRDCWAYRGVAVCK